MHRDWEFQKRKIFEELGQHLPGSAGDSDWNGRDSMMGDGSRGFNPNASAVSAQSGSRGRDGL